MIDIEEYMINGVIQYCTKLDFLFDVTDTKLFGFHPPVKFLCIVQIQIT